MQRVTKVDCRPDPTVEKSQHHLPNDFGVANYLELTVSLGEEKHLLSITLCRYLSIPEVGMDDIHHRVTVGHAWRFLAVF